MQVTKKAPAKVNLALLVGPTNEEGLHELFTVFVPIDLYDELHIKLEARLGDTFAGKLTVKCAAVDGEANLAAQALRLLEEETGWAFDGRVSIEKHIPVGGGLGGGSSDAASALVAGVQALVEAGGPAPSRDRQVELARRLGADVAFFLDPRPAIGRGVGEILEPISLPELHLVLVTYERHLSTERVYRTYDEMQPFGNRLVFEHRATDAEKRWRQVADVGQLGRMLENDLEKTVYSIIPQIATDREVLMREGAMAALVSGSGPTLYGLCAVPEKCEELVERMGMRGFKARAVTVRPGVA